MTQIGTKKSVCGAIKIAHCILKETKDYETAKFTKKNE